MEKDLLNPRVRSLELSYREVREAKDELIRMSNSEEQRALYEMRAKILKDKVSALNKARREGIEEGIKEGIHGVALNMKKAGIDFQVIQQMTGLSVEVIERLKPSKR